MSHERGLAELLSDLLGELNVSHAGAALNSGPRKGTETAALGALWDPSYIGNGVRW